MRHLAEIIETMQDWEVLDVYYENEQTEQKFQETK